MATINNSNCSSVGYIESDPDMLSGSLQRLFGAEYLRKHLPIESEYRAPRFIVVIENDVTTLPVLVSQAGFSLVIDNFDTTYGEILAEKITGPAVCDGCRDFSLRLLGYVDFSDPGNVRQSTADGKRYVVDTEWKSLVGLVERVDDLDYLSYLKTRFQVFHPWALKPYDINIKL
jgi:hypothetical protein